jgi:hypothetical protein
VEYEKKFLIIGNQNAITYREVFPLIKQNNLWLGVDNGGTKWFQVKDNYDITTESRKKVVNGTKYFSMGSIMWFTNLDHGRRHRELPLMTTAENLKFSKNLKGKQGYWRYDNYDALEVPTFKEIPSDYDGAMGVPITFLDKYNPQQFEILGATESEGKGFSNGLWRGGTAQGMVNGQRVYKRIFIRHRKPKKGNQA